MAIFATIPAHGYGIVVLRGMVAVYDTEILHREDVQEGAFYVRESQRPPSCLPWVTWLREAVADEAEHRTVGPHSPLVIRREVVQAIRWPYPEDWALRLEGGSWVDGPYREGAFGRDLVGKVVGLFIPGPGTA
jgi:hypothetical protein